MPTLKLDFKHFLISDENIGNLPEYQYSNYAFGFVNEKHKFVPAFIGRTDSNLKDEIKAASDQKTEEGRTYTHFKFKRALTQLDAYERECKNYHDFGFRKDGTTKQLDNMMHPTKPSGASSCPVVNCYH